MRSILLGALAVLAGFCGVVAWEQWQIVGLKRQVAAQAALLDQSRWQQVDVAARLNADDRARARMSVRMAAMTRQQAASSSLLRRQAEAVAAARVDERRQVLSPYEEAIARLELPAEAASRLKDLLLERSEAILDAKDAAQQQGIAEGSAEMATAITLAADDVGAEIAALIGPVAARNFNGPALAEVGIPDAASPELPAQPEFAPAPGAQPAVYVLQAPPAPQAPAPAFDEYGPLQNQLASPLLYAGGELYLNGGLSGLPALAQPGSRRRSTRTSEPAVVRLQRENARRQEAARMLINGSAGIPISASDPVRQAARPRQ